MTTHDADVTPTGFIPVNGQATRVFARVGLILAAAAFVALGLFFCLNGRLNADEGFYLQASRLVSQGLSPYRDFGFTQTPLVPYADVPLLELFGFDLTGQRLAALTWTTLTAGLGVWLLVRRHGLMTAVVFLMLLLAAPGWFAFATIGKTYAFAGLAVILGAVVLTSRGPAFPRWMAFTGAAALAVASRLPTLPFFAIGWIWLACEEKRGSRRVIGILLTLLMASSVLLWCSSGTSVQFEFWTIDFHRVTGMRRSLAIRLTEGAVLAPGIWLALVCLTALAAARRVDRKTLAILSALIGAVVVNLSTRGTYGEYVVPFVPATAFAVAQWLRSAIGRMRLAWAVAVGMTALVLGWVRPPVLDANVLRSSSEAAAFLRTAVAPDAFVVASMPEIPVASGHRIPDTLALGKFAITESFDADSAAYLHMVTPEDLVALIANETTGAVVLARGSAWNFAWSLPTYRWLSRPAVDRIFGAIEQEYFLGFQNDTYVVFLHRKRSLAEAGHSSGI